MSSPLSATALLPPEGASPLAEDAALAADGELTGRVIRLRFAIEAPIPPDGFY